MNVTSPAERENNLIDLSLHNVWRQLWRLATRNLLTRSVLTTIPRECLINEENSTRGFSFLSLDCWFIAAFSIQYTIIFQLSEKPANTLNWVKRYIQVLFPWSTVRETHFHRRPVSLFIRNNFHSINGFRYSLETHRPPPHPCRWIKESPDGEGGVRLIRGRNNGVGGAFF